MAPQEQPTFTLAELVELNEREQMARGVSSAEVSRELRVRLDELRETQGAEAIVAQPQPERWRQTGLELRVAALEEELKRLRDRIEEKNG